MNFYRQTLSLAICSAFLFCAGLGGPLRANPLGLKVVSGTATTKTSGSLLNVTVSSSAILNWSSFNIMSGETTSFLQPSGNSIVLNEIGGSNPSKIWGTLTGNGTVILANASGFYFGPNSMIKVGGNFIATTTPLPPDDGIGSSWIFTGMPPLASIVNYGQIAAGSGHGLYLIAEQIDNEGSLSAPGGQVGLYAGKSVLLSERPDGRGVSATVQMPAGTVDNNGRITANAGEIALDAQVVNQNGIIQADSVQNQNGVISLVASDLLNLGASSQILARGDGSPGGSPGGSVTLRSANSFSDSVGSQITTTGGGHGGNGGNVEVSAPNILSLNSSIRAGALAGWNEGLFLMDPQNIVLGTSFSSSPPAGTVDMNVNTSFQNIGANILLEATGNITLNSGTTWNLSASTLETTGTLTLQAGGNIIFGNKSEILDANDWSVNLQAGVSGGTVQSGTGNIFLNGGSGGTGSGTVQTAAGTITMTAGESIKVGSGAIRTTGGGGINLNALAGDINGGTGNVGYTLSGQYGYTVGASPTAPSLAGGIATTAGGDVTLTAGDNIICTPSAKVNSGQTPGASGAYGSEPGNVTLTAGNEVMGNFVVANGTGTILTGASVQSGQPPQILNANATIGTSTAPVTLSLITGSWNVFSGGNIYLSQVYNPNGTYNANALGVNFLGAPNGAFTGNIGDPTVPASSTFLFNYAPNAAANLWAGDGITLTGASLPKINGAEMDPVYPPVLALNAGSGGIAVNTTICLYPSSQGGLQITTRDGGDLSGTQQQTTLTGIVMSDSGLPGYSTFLSGHALTPLYENNLNPVTLNITGDIDSFGLTVPTFAQITVAGNTYNFGFLGQNVSPLQTTFISVGGNVTYRGDQTSVSLTDPLPASMFSSTLSGDPAVTSLLSYNASTGLLTYIGQMTGAELTYLLNPTVVVLNSSGQPEMNPDGTPVTKPLTLDATQQAAIQALYTASQNATLGDQGLALAGPGEFNISASSMDLGISGGISVLAPDSALAAISPSGAELNINLSGNLEMTATKIANNGLLGDITLTSGGALDIGGEFTPYGDPNSPKGIFTTSGGSISVNARGDVNIDGSRIAAYNGGNITVFSQNGDVNAGTGGSGFVNVTAEQLNGKTGLLSTISESIPGSGILATTLFGSVAQLGNIIVNSPDGSINASLGGIIQIAFNGANSHNNYIDLTAGQNINASGSGVIGSNIRLKAGGDITGLVVGTESVNINSQQNVAVTAISSGLVDISASGTVTGTVIGGSGVNVSGESITAALESTSVTTTGNSSGATTGVPQSNVAHDNAPVMEDTSTNVTRFAQESIEDNKKDKPIMLTQRTGRVTLILPPIK